MKPLYDAEGMRRCDAIAIRDFGIPGIVLMENASRAAADVAARMLGDIGPGGDAPVLLFCGRGNNGGDGFGVARHLANRGHAVEVRTLADDADIAGDARVNLDILRRMEDGERVVIVRHTAQDIPLTACGRQPALVVDAMFGTGLSAPIEGPAAAIVAALNESGLPVLALDIPSGIRADNGGELGIAVRADATVTMGAVKTGLLLHRGRECAGTVHVADIGMPRAVFGMNPANTYRIEETDIDAWLPRRAFDAHKYLMGSVFVLAGSPGMTGAAAMASESALRGGAGMVRLGIPAGLNPIMEAKLTEVITVPLGETIAGTLGMEDFDAILQRVNDATVAIVGPGLSRHDETLSLIRRIIEHARTPLILDADALFALVGHTEILTQSKHPIIVTPHVGEFARLTGSASSDVERNRVEHARSFAMRHGVTAVLKGAPTVIGTAGGDVFVNSTGNPGMATAGSGDVLAGIIGGLVAQGASMEHGACAGVFLHGIAGDRAAREAGERGMIATDIVHGLTRYFAESGRISNQRQ